MTKPIIITILLAWATATVLGQDAAARRVLDNALAALGGEAKIKSLRSIYFSGRGFEDGEVNAQPYEPGRSYRNAHEEKLAVFLDGRRLAYELKTDRGDGTTRHRRFFFPDSRRVVADFINRSAGAVNIQYPSADRDQDARRVPHALLLEVRTNESALKYVGTREYAGRPHEVVSISLPNARVPILLFVDSQTSLLSKYEFTADFPGLGTSVFEYVFESHRPHRELGFFPQTQEIKIDGRVFRSVKIDAALAGSAEADAMLTLPPDLEGFIMPAGTVREVAAGVYFIYNVNGFQPMFIEFDTYIMAIEAPANVPTLEDTPVETIGNINAATEQYIAKIKQTIPDKPIKYVVITHAHADHFGGLRAFIPEKPIVLTTPASKSYIKKFVPELQVEALDGKTLYTDDRQSVEVINVGRNPHTDENLIVHLPRPNYLFQGDLFYFNSEATFPAGDRMTVMPFFAKWLKKNNLSPVRIYGFHSVNFGSMKHIEKILEVNAKTENKTIEAEQFGKDIFDGIEVFRGSFSSHGNTFYFFKKVTQGEEEYRIFESRMVNGKWTTPKQLNLGGDHSDMYPAISKDGKRLVFSSYRPSSSNTSEKPNAHLWYVEKLKNGDWSKPVFLERVNKLGHYHSWVEFGWDGNIYFRQTTPDWKDTKSLISRWNGKEYTEPVLFEKAERWKNWNAGVRVVGGSQGPNGEIIFLDVATLNPATGKGCVGYLGFDQKRW